MQKVKTPNLNRFLASKKAPVPVEIIRRKVQEYFKLRAERERKAA